MTDVFIKLINILNAAKAATPYWPDLDAYEERLLDELMIAWDAADSAVTVSDAVILIRGISKSTMHKKVKLLVAAGVIMLVPSPVDSRSKLIVPTALTRQYNTALTEHFK